MFFCLFVLIVLPLHTELCSRILQGEAYRTWCKRVSYYDSTLFAMSVQQSQWNLWSWNWKVLGMYNLFILALFSPEHIMTVTCERSFWEKYVYVLFGKRLTSPPSLKKIENLSAIFLRGPFSKILKFFEHLRLQNHELF